MIVVRRVRGNDCIRLVDLLERTDTELIYKWNSEIRTYSKKINNTQYFSILSDNILIGFIELNWKDKQCEVCKFIIDKKYHDKIFIEKSIKLILDYAFDCLEVEDVCIFDNNSKFSEITWDKFSGIKLEKEEFLSDGLKVINLKREEDVEECS